MTQIGMTDDTEVARHPRSAGILAMEDRQPSLARTCWQWLTSISQVAVEHHYAAPWEHAGDRRQSIETKARG